MAEATPTDAAVRPVVYVVPRQTVHWVIAALLAVIATTLLLREGGPLGAQAAFGQTGMLGAKGLFAFTGQLDKTKYGLWMMDQEAGTIWCYEYNPVRGRMKLVAARSFRYDRYLDNFNQDDPSPEQVSELLRHQRESQQRAANLVTPLPDLAGLSPATQPVRSAEAGGS